MECKARNILRIFRTLPDLIDTLWNVKSAFLSALSKSARDLIDTLWNVKTGDAGTWFASAKGI